MKPDLLSHLLHTIHQLNQNLLVLLWYQRSCAGWSKAEVCLPGSSSGRWVGMWLLAKAQTVVWLMQGMGLQHASEGSRMVLLVVTTSGQQAGASQTMRQVQSQERPTYSIVQAKIRTKSWSWNFLLSWMGTKYLCCSSGQVGPDCWATQMSRKGSGSSSIHSFIFEC